MLSPLGLSQEQGRIRRAPCDGRLLGGISQRQARHTETQRHHLRFEPALSKESRIAACQRSPCMGWSQTWQQTVVVTSK